MNEFLPYERMNKQKNKSKGCTDFCPGWIVKYLGQFCLRALWSSRTSALPRVGSVCWDPALW